jgi:hypothetical protein
MQIALKAMVIGEQTQPTYIESTLQAFFIDDAHSYKENRSYPFDFTTNGKTTWCAILEGGCQFSFDRDRSAPIRCIGCDLATCECCSVNRNRYALQRFTKTRIYLLDIDQNCGIRARSYETFNKLHTLTCEEEQDLRKMEFRLTKLENIVFFYRTKCNGFRIGFDAGRDLETIQEYEELACAAEARVKECTPDQKLAKESSVGGAVFCIDRICDKNGNAMRSHAYWSYPRVYHPTWLNPKRQIP